MNPLYNVVTSLRKLNAEIVGLVDVINNLCGQIKEVQSVKESSLSTKTLGLLYLSTSEEMLKLNESLEKLAGFIHLITQTLMESDQVPSETYLDDLVVLLRHLTRVHKEHTNVIEDLNQGPIRKTEPFRTNLSLIDGDFHLVSSLQRLRADLLLAQEEID
ncbi:unnamed protein product [Bursaphelenchus okinawaensis]|uniref:Uncharacterized protein n=1 Tax=Bursaphelenchus okinawaensis TaxID=465554 RepID=A0A811LIH4_9BILA|nr:unnamed protein product [Bursaphelenchus okinawaensis]CAG9123248.1 unnamed protein product [Bursaphelenchus okinawaensis]